VAEWEEIARFLQENFTVEREWPGRAVAIVCDGTTQPYRMLIGKNHPGFGGVEHVTVEAVLGPPDQLNLVAAVKSAAKLMGGVVCADDMVSIRDSRCLSTLSVDHLNMMIGYMGGAIESYYLLA
jgi:hypothetical protein